MKMHLRLINRSGQPLPQFRIACGNPLAKWTSDTTSDASKLTCKRCQKAATRKEAP